MNLALDHRARIAISAVVAIALLGGLVFVAVSQRSRGAAASDRARSSTPGRMLTPPNALSPRIAGPAHARPTMARRPRQSDAFISKNSDRRLPLFIPIGAAPGERARSSLSQLYGRDSGPSMEELSQCQQGAVLSNRNPSFPLVEEASDADQQPDLLTAFVNQALRDITEQVDSYTTYDIGRDYMKVSMVYDGSGYLGVSFHALFKAPL
jgi:hypothetical protein